MSYGVGFQTSAGSAELDHWSVNCPYFGLAGSPVRFLTDRMVNPLQLIGSWIAKRTAQTMSYVSSLDPLPMNYGQDMVWYTFQLGEYLIFDPEGYACIKNHLSVWLCIFAEPICMFDWIICICILRVVSLGGNIYKRAGMLTYKLLKIANI